MAFGTSFGTPRRGTAGQPNEGGTAWGAPGGSIRTQPGMVSGGGPSFGLPNFQGGPLGNMVGNELYNPETGGFQRTGAQKGTNAGQALKALQEASGLNLLGSGSSSGFGGAGGAGVPRISMPDTTAANAAVFARAKDQAGETARAALTGLRGEMAGRGILGSGIEGGETANIIGQAAGGVNEITREQAIQDAANQARLAGTQYQGDITQRGQDINNQQSAAARQQQMIQGLLSVLPPGMLY